MQLWIDDIEIESPDSLEAAFEIAREQTEKNGRLIIDILADGQPIKDELIDDMPNDSAGISQLRMSTTDARSFIIDILKSAQESLQITEADQQSATELIHAGNFKDAIATLSAIIEGWHAVREVIDQTADLSDLDVNTLSIVDAKGNTTNGEQCIESLTKALEELRSSIQQQDWSSLADAIEYDLNDQINLWNALLNTMIENIPDSLS